MFDQLMNGISRDNRLRFKETGFHDPKSLFWPDITLMLIGATLIKTLTVNFSYRKKQPCGSYQSCIATCKNRRNKDVKNIKQNLKLEQNWLLSQFQSKASSLDTLVFL